MGQAAGRNHTRTTSEKEMCLIIDFSFQLFSSTAVTWKPMRHAGEEPKIIAIPAYRALTKQDVKKQLREKSAIQTVFSLQDR
jgi:hypothetical protein